MSAEPSDTIDFEKLLADLDKMHPTVSIALGGKPTLYSRSAEAIRALMKERAKPSDGDSK